MAAFDAVYDLPDLTLESAMDAVLMMTPRSSAPSIFGVDRLLLAHLPRQPAGC